MRAKRSKTKKSFLRGVHLQAIVFLVIYTFISKTIFIKSLTSSSLAVNFFVPYIFGVIAGMTFLYFLSHEDFFHFMHEIEKVEKKKEKGYMRKYIHYGKILSTLIIAAVGGPIFAALTIRFLLNRVWYKYLILAVGNLASTVLAVSLVKGFLFFV